MPWTLSALTPSTASRCPAATPATIPATTQLTSPADRTALQHHRHRADGAGVPEQHCDRRPGQENLQARVRGTTLMALSNQDGHLVLATGNKSELAVGYSTLYGDAVGGFAPLKDVSKTLVWRLAGVTSRPRSARRSRRFRNHPSSSRRVRASPRPAGHRFAAAVRAARRRARRLRRAGSRLW